ncbi:MAG TPA: DUF2240 family protein, partial [Archaeoglobaceae archaeon]|nr:DUF2240 family protein [Archaeoglobaceae archaeon]
YVLSFDLKWFTHEKSRQVVDVAIEKGLLKEESDKLRPTFDIDKIEIPFGFRPELKKLISTTTFDEIIWEISEKSGKDVSEVTSMVNRTQERLKDLLNVEVVALIIAKSYSIDVKKYIDRVWAEAID